MRSSLKAASKVFKFISVASVSAFCVLAADHYYQAQKHAQSLLPKLNLTVFIDRNCKDDAEVCNAIEELGLLTIDEYVSAEDAYAKAVEKNPFLKDISVPGDNEIFQSYVKAVPAEFPTDDFLVVTRNAVAAIDGVYEVVFNPDNFKEYVASRNFLDFYRKLLTGFAIVMALLLIVQSALFIMQDERNSWKLITNSIAYLLASALGFICVWSACLFIQHPLLVDEAAAFYIIPITAAFGIILKD